MALSFRFGPLLLSCVSRMVDHDDVALADLFATGIVALDDDVVQEGKENLPEDGLPSVGLQDGSVGRNRREQGLTGTLSHRRPGV